MSMDLEEQYDKIYRYCYFKVHHKELAEDITQEAFLRFLGNREYSESGKGLRYLYTIARNLCIDEYRKNETEPIDDETLEEKLFYQGHEETVVNGLALKQALAELYEEDRELLLLRYVNDVPVSAICNLFGMSRFALYRRLNKLLKKLKDSLEGRQVR